MLCFYILCVCLPTAIKAERLYLLCWGSAPRRSNERRYACETRGDDVVAAGVLFGSICGWLRGQKRVLALTMRVPGSLLICVWLPQLVLA